MGEKEIVSVTITYEDGTTENVTKGIVIEEKPGQDDRITTTFYSVQMNTLDIANITTALMQFADRLGIIDNLKSDDCF